MDEDSKFGVGKPGLHHGDRSLTQPSFVTTEQKENPRTLKVTRILCLLFS